MRHARGRVTGLAAPVTSALIAINVLVYLITVAQGAGINAPGGKLFSDWALVGVLVDQGDWWRLFTAMFLHGGVLHIAFNMFALWWLGSVVEQALGALRFLLIYFCPVVPPFPAHCVVYQPNVGVPPSLVIFCGSSSSNS